LGGAAARRHTVRALAHASATIAGLQSLISFEHSSRADLVALTA
jgi:hypothetical protein